MSSDENRDDTNKKRTRGGGGAPPFEKGKSGNPAGRPKGGKNFATLAKEQVDEYNARLKSGERMLTPLDLFTMVANDSKLELTMRMRAAEAAAPYIHAKVPQKAPEIDPNDGATRIRKALADMLKVSNAS